MNYKTLPPFSLTSLNYRDVAIFFHTTCDFLRVVCKVQDVSSNGRNPDTSKTEVPGRFGVSRTSTTSLPPNEKHIIS